MKKQRGYSDRCGMGAESDSISEQFVLSERYRMQQRAMIQTFIAAGMSSEEVADMFCGWAELPLSKKEEDQ
jgi:hypothetical protein